jgi:hypothetical protein
MTVDKKYVMHSDGAYYESDHPAKPHTITVNPVTTRPNLVDGGGKRLNTGKVELSLVPNSAMYAIARVFEAGAKKYEKNNWRRGMSHTVVYNCALRHMLKYSEGEDTDTETGESHLAHALTNLALLVEYQTTCPELDDRYTGKMATYKQFEKAKVLGTIEFTEADMSELARRFDNSTTKDPL